MAKGRPAPALPAPARRRNGRLASGAVIMEAATTVFLRNGYAGTSMDEIAALAGVSKQTIYTHFADKERLFSDLILQNAERVDQFVAELQSILETADGVEKALVELAGRYIGLVIRPEVLQLRRLVIGEAARFPDLAETYYNRVPERVLGTLAAQFGRLAERGLLRLDDPILAANQFVALILWAPLDRAMFHLEQQSLTPRALDKLAASGVRVFLAAYGTP